MSRSNRDRHGAPRPVDLTTWLGEDPNVALVTADMDDWLAAHPCDCDALCSCDEQELQ